MESSVTPVSPNSAFPWAGIANIFTVIVRQSEVLLLWKGTMTLVLSPFLLLAFVFVLFSSHAGQETALAENCLYKGKKKNRQLGDRSSS